MIPAVLDPDRNPVLDAAGTHTGVARFVFVGGRLFQLFYPCDGVSAPEWREVPTLDVPPVDLDAP